MQREKSNYEEESEIAEEVDDREVGRQEEVQEIHIEEKIGQCEVEHQVIFPEHMKGPQFHERYVHQRVEEFQGYIVDVPRIRLQKESGQREQTAPRLRAAAKPGTANVAAGSTKTKANNETDKAIVPEDEVQESYIEEETVEREIGRQIMTPGDNVQEIGVEAKLEEREGDHQQRVSRDAEAQARKREVSWCCQGRGEAEAHKREVIWCCQSRGEAEAQKREVSWCCQSRAEAEAHRYDR